jgi:hypothetical protein
LISPWAVLQPFRADFSYTNKPTGQPLKYSETSVNTHAAQVAWTINTGAPAFMIYQTKAPKNKDKIAA